MNWLNTISFLLGACVAGIGLKLLTLLTMAHLQGGYVILPVFPNLFDAVIITAGAIWLLIYPILQKLKVKDVERCVELQ